MYSELVKRLRRCSQFRCRGCEYENITPCRTKLNNEAADAIEGLQKALNAVNDAHNEGYDVRPVVRGEWIICSDGYYPYCSVCKNEPQGRVMTDFCPNCGADMRGERDE